MAFQRTERPVQSSGLNGRVRQRVSGKCARELIAVGLAFLSE